MTPPRSSLAFASFLAYTPRGDTAAIRLAKNFVIALKENRMAGSETAAARVARRLRERTDVPFTEQVLSADRALVPIPRSGLRRADALWPSLEITSMLHEQGFGSSVLPCLERQRPVPKAATSSTKARPKARAHFESLTLHDPLALPAKVTLVDDVVTRGAQLFGAAWKIWSIRPDVDVLAFAVVRTISSSENFSTLDAPRAGTIRWRDEECLRRP